MVIFCRIRGPAAAAAAARPPARASTFSPRSMPRRRCVSLPAGSRRLALEVALKQIVVCLVLTAELARACARCLPPGGQLFRRCFRRTAWCGMLARRPAALRPAGYLLPSGYWRAGCLLRPAGLASPFGRPDLLGRRFGGRAGPCGRSGAQPACAREGRWVCATS